MKNGMNKEVMMLHEFQTPPMSSNLSSLRKKIKKKQFIVHTPFLTNYIFIISISYIGNIIYPPFLIWIGLYTYFKLAL